MTRIEQLFPCAVGRLNRRSFWGYTVLYCWPQTMYRPVFELEPWSHPFWTLDLVDLRRYTLNRPQADDCLITDWCCTAFFRMCECGCIASFSLVFLPFVERSFLLLFFFFLLLCFVLFFLIRNNLVAFSVTHTPLAFYVAILVISSATILS